MGSCIFLEKPAAALVFSSSSAVMVKGGGEDDMVEGICLVCLFGVLRGSSMGMKRDGAKQFLVSSILQWKRGGAA